MDTDMRDSLMEDVWVVIPAYNEAQVISTTARDVLSRFPNVVVVDDGSRDDTSLHAHQAGAHVCRHPINLGQGAALATGISYALTKGADAVITFDADGQHRIEDAAEMLRILKAKNVDVVLASRFLGAAIGISSSKSLFLRAATIFTRVTSRIRVTDTHNGLRVFSQRGAQAMNIRQNRMAHASEILDLIAKNKLRFVEAPCTIKYTAYSVKKGQRISAAGAILADLLFGRLRR